jgi:glycosyltransferase involved in cell wall biosynthesis
MQLLILTNVFPNPHQPTKGTFNLALARALAGEHDVRVVTPVSWIDEWQARRKGRRNIPPERCEAIDGMEVHYPRYYYTPKILRRQYGRFYWYSVRGTLYRLLAARRPDVILSYWAHPDGEAAVRLGRRANVPAVVMVGGSDVLLLTSDAGRRRCILKVLQDAQAVVTVGNDLKHKLVTAGLPEEKIHVVNRGVDGDRFTPGNQQEARQRLRLPLDRKILLWVGRMDPVKGLDVLLEACALLRQNLSDFHLCLVGDGFLRPTLEATCQARGLADRVTFVGSVLHDGLADWYRAADYTVLPSRSEGIPNVLRESLACGTPFVASRVGGIPELAEGPHHRLVPPGDPAALAQALRQILSQPVPRAERQFQSVSWEESAEQLLRVLRPLVGPVTEPVPS